MPEGNIHKIETPAEKVAKLKNGDVVFYQGKRFTIDTPATTTSGNGEKNFTPKKSKEGKPRQKYGLLNEAGEPELEATKENLISAFSLGKLSFTLPVETPKEIVLAGKSKLKSVLEKIPLEKLIFKTPLIPKLTEQKSETLSLIEPNSTIKKPKNKEEGAPGTDPEILDGQKKKPAIENTGAEILEELTQLVKSYNLQPNEEKKQGVYKLFDKFSQTRGREILKLLNNSGIPKFDTISTDRTQWPSYYGDRVDSAIAIIQDIAKSIGQKPEEIKVALKKITKTKQDYVSMREGYLKTVEVVRNILGETYMHGLDSDSTEPTYWYAIFYNPQLNAFPKYLDELTRILNSKISKEDKEIETPEENEPEPFKPEIKPEIKRSDFEKFISSQSSKMLELLKNSGIPKFDKADEGVEGVWTDEDEKELEELKNMLRRLQE